jgi:ribosome maturation factor RimP
MQLVGLIEQAVTGLGYELVDFETSPRGRLLRVFVDKLPGQGSLSIDDCSAVSNHLSRLLVVEGVDYDRLEVSSPGLDRALTKAADWQRYVDHDVQFKLRIAIGNQRNFVGRIVGTREEQAVVMLEGEEREFPLAGIERARLVPRF